jgi:lipoprotein-anchoring transpeptidase ErfK/SrfK
MHGGEYAIHGTNRPASIGGLVFCGCTRTYNSDIREPYRPVSGGTPVAVEP